MTKKKPIASRARPPVSQQAEARSPGPTSADLESTLSLKYALAVGAHTTLLACTALFLPRAALPFVPRPDESTFTSRDKPQHPFMDALTMRPLLTVVCACVGAAVLQGWWGVWLRAWSVRLVSGSGVGAKEGTPESEKESEQLVVRLSGIMGYTSFLLDSTLPGATGRTNCDVRSVFRILHGVHPVRSPTDKVKAALPDMRFPSSTPHSHYLHTYFLSLLVSLLTVFVPAYTIGVPALASDARSHCRFTWIRLFAELS
jgi:phosphatidylinositol glycan class F